MKRILLCLLAALSAIVVKIHINVERSGKAPDGKGAASETEVKS